MVRSRAGSQLDSERGHGPEQCGDPERDDQHQPDAFRTQGRYGAERDAEHDRDRPEGVGTQRPGDA